MSASEKRLTVILVALAAVTLISWGIGARHGAGAVQLNAAVTFGVLLIAAIKVRIIIMEFMEARHAPVLLRRLADGWLALLMVTLIALYVAGLGFRPG